MVKNTDCLNTANCCVFKCSNVNNNTTGVNSQSVPKASLILFISAKQQKKRNPLENDLNN